MDKALLVGINKYADAPLRGCINDITDMAEHLIAHCNFKDGNIVYWPISAQQKVTLLSV
ncbi:MAG: caspase family protein [Bacteroidetes bacterium]|nr:caspase family protein [Bacteroidota bacterium]